MSIINLTTVETGFGYKSFVTEIFCFTVRFQINWKSESIDDSITAVVRCHKYELVIYVSRLKFTYLSKVKIFIFPLVKNPAVWKKVLHKYQNCTKKTAEYKGGTNTYSRFFLNSTQLSKLLSMYVLMVYRYFSRYISRYIFQDLFQVYLYKVYFKICIFQDIFQVRVLSTVTKQNLL